MKVSILQVHDTVFLQESFGDLVDFFNSYEDLKLQTIQVRYLSKKKCSKPNRPSRNIHGILTAGTQVLHSLSFVEDPTRIFRAVRFEQRYQWSISQQTMVSTANLCPIFDSVIWTRLTRQHCTDSRSYRVRRS